MKCPSCGAEVTGKFCSYCGTEVIRGDTINININNYYNSGAQGAGNPNNGGSKIICPACGQNNTRIQREQYEQGLFRTIGICNGCGNTWIIQQDVPVSAESKSTVFIICLLFGMFGVHNFYVGRTTRGLLYLFTMGLCGVGWIADLISIQSGTFTDASGYPIDS